MFDYLLLWVAGLSFGGLSAAGVFTVLVAVGLVPRFAGKTRTGAYVLWYEEMVILGTLSGSFFSMFPQYSQFGAWLREHWPNRPALMEGIGQVGSSFFGFFCGIFVGCLALAIAEMLDSIPIFSRRVNLKKGTGAAIFSMAIGKLAGSLFYFWEQLYGIAR